MTTSRDEYRRSEAALEHFKSRVSWPFLGFPRRMIQLPRGEHRCVARNLGTLQASGDAGPS